MYSILWQAYTCFVRTLIYTGRLWKSLKNLKAFIRLESFSIREDETWVHPVLSSWKWAGTWPRVRLRSTAWKMNILHSFFEGWETQRYDFVIVIQRWRCINPVFLSFYHGLKALKNRLLVSFECPLQKRQINILFGKIIERKSIILVCNVYF